MHHDLLKPRAEKLQIERSSVVKVQVIIFRAKSTVESFQLLIGYHPCHRKYASASTQLVMLGMM